MQTENGTSSVVMPKTVVDHLQLVIIDFLKRKPHLSINGISKKCNVSEPTLRRIMTGRVKTLPQVTTLLDILTYLANTSSIREIVRQYPGPIGDFLKEAMPFLEEFDQDYSNALNLELKNPIKYVIYKLAINHIGVTEQKVMELYGNHGLQKLTELMEAGFIYKDANNVCRAKAKSFSGTYADFVRNFKVIADYIKPEKHKNRKALNPFFVNCSDSLNAEAYEKIARLQRSTQRKIRQILADPASKGSIPSFYICAFDTLDIKSAIELEEDKDFQ